MMNMSTKWIAARFIESNPLKETSNLTQFLRLLFYLLITGPLCEELGWRGFVLPRLPKRFNPFTASLILGVIWGVWHLPSFFLSGMVQACRCRSSCSTHYSYPSS